MAVVVHVALYLKLEDFKSFHKTNKRTNIGFENIEHSKAGKFSINLGSVDKVGPLGGSEYRDCVNMGCCGYCKVMTTVTFC